MRSPLVLNYLKGTLALAHNGNITNASELRQSLQEGGAIFRSTTDSEVIACDIARERTHTSCVEDAILQTARKLKGGLRSCHHQPQKTDRRPRSARFKTIMSGQTW